MASFDDRRKAALRADIGLGAKRGWHHTPSSFSSPYFILRTWLYDSYMYEDTSSIYEYYEYFADPTIPRRCHYAPHVSGILSLGGHRCALNAATYNCAVTNDRHGVPAAHTRFSKNSAWPIELSELTAIPDFFGSYSPMQGALSAYTVCLDVFIDRPSQADVHSIAAACINIRLQNKTTVPLNTIVISDAPVPAVLHPYRELNDINAHVSSYFHESPKLVGMFKSYYKCVEQQPAGVSAAERGSAAVGNLTTVYFTKDGNEVGLIYRVQPAVYGSIDVLYKGLSSWVLRTARNADSVVVNSYGTSFSCTRSAHPTFAHVISDNPFVNTLKSGTSYVVPTIIKDSRKYVFPCDDFVIVKSGCDKNLVIKYAETEFPVYARAEEHGMFVSHPAETLYWNYPTLTPEFDFCAVQVKLNAFDISVRHAYEPISWEPPYLDYNCASIIHGPLPVCAYEHDPHIGFVSYFEGHCVDRSFSVVTPIADFYSAAELPCKHTVVMTPDGFALSADIAVIPHIAIKYAEIAPCFTTAIVITHIQTELSCDNGAVPKLGCKGYDVVIQEPWCGSKQPDIAILNLGIKVSYYDFSSIPICADKSVVETDIATYSEPLLAFYDSYVCVIEGAVIAEPGPNNISSFPGIFILGVEYARDTTAANMPLVGEYAYSMSGAYTAYAAWNSTCPSPAVEAGCAYASKGETLVPVNADYYSYTVSGVHTVEVQTYKSLCAYKTVDVGFVQFSTTDTLGTCNIDCSSAFAAAHVYEAAFKCADSRPDICGVAVSYLDAMYARSLVPTMPIIDRWLRVTQRSVLYRMGDEALLSVPDSVYRGIIGVSHLRRTAMAHVIEPKLTPYFKCGISVIPMHTVAPSDLPKAYSFSLSPTISPDNKYLATSGMPVQYRADNWYGFGAVYKGYSYAELLSYPTAGVGIMVGFINCGRASVCAYGADDSGYVEFANSSKFYTAEVGGNYVHAIENCYVPMSVQCASSGCDVYAFAYSDIIATCAEHVTPSQLYTMSAYTAGVGAAYGDLFSLIVSRAQQIVNIGVALSGTASVYSTSRITPIYCVYESASIVTVLTSYMINASSVCPSYAEKGELLAASSGLNSAAYSIYSVHPIEPITIVELVPCKMQVAMRAAELVSRHICDTRYADYSIWNIAVALEHTIVIPFTGDDMVCEIPAHTASSVVTTIIHTQIRNSVDSAHAVLHTETKHQSCINAACKMYGCVAHYVVTSISESAGTWRSNVIHVPTCEVAAGAQDYFSSCAYPAMEIGLEFTTDFDIRALLSESTPIAINDILMTSLQCDLFNVGSYVAYEVGGVFTTQAYILNTQYYENIAYAEVGALMTSCTVRVTAKYDAHVADTLFVTTADKFVPISHKHDISYTALETQVALVCGKPGSYAKVADAADNIVWARKYTSAKPPTHTPNTFCSLPLMLELACGKAGTKFDADLPDVIIPVQPIRYKIMYVPVCPDLALHYDFQDDSATQLSFVF